MRIWTLHPQHLDRQGLLALWREGLLAQAVLLGKTRGYLNHPQLARFRKQQDPVAAIATYLAAVHVEAVKRGYEFNANKISKRKSRSRITETRGQLLYEWQLLKTKLSLRSTSVLSQAAKVKEPCPHPLFRIIPGQVRNWERQKAEPDGAAYGAKPCCR
ncbi:MAG: pyrimidine dimer DNA glycosylase/endonuclease V [Kiritimatiellae bacterium]|nr:pyrimidine dimer DNA glycosylase/endonuclease V [Kiritimatiellia bacterium]